MHRPATSLAFASVAVSLFVVACAKAPEPQAAPQAQSAAPSPAPPAAEAVAPTAPPAAAPATAVPAPRRAPTKAAPAAIAVAPAGPAVAVAAPTEAPAAPPTATAAPPATAAPTAQPAVTAAAAALHAAVGSEKCRMCHRLQYESWATSKHAQASPAVGCESCHGNGKDYATISVMKDRPRAIAAGLVLPAVASCTATCHKPGAITPEKFATVHAHKTAGA